MPPRESAERALARSGWAIVFKVMAQAKDADWCDDYVVPRGPALPRLVSTGSVPIISEFSENSEIYGVAGHRRWPGNALARRAAVRWHAAKSAVEEVCAHIDLAPDLGRDIGSRTWLRGLATMLGLSAFALLFWPDISAVEASTGTSQPVEAHGEFLRRTIKPLGLGGDTGRRMTADARVRPLDSVPERPSIQLVSTLGVGDGLGRMLERAGVAAGDVGRIQSLVAGAIPVGEIAPGTRFDITLGRRPAPDAPRPLEGLAFRARFDLDLAVERGPGGLALTRYPIRVDETPLRIRGTIGSSFYRSARNAGAPLGAIQEWLRTVDQHLSLESDLEAGDEFDMIVSYKRSARGERQAGRLLYAGIEHAGKPRLQLLRWGRDGQFYSASGFGQVQSAQVGAPVAGHVTSGYGMRRHPILRYARMHAGVDFGARYGSPIYAVSDGIVDYAGRHGGHGNYVRLNHGGGLGTGYAHMSRIAVGPGMSVRAGQVIGYVGSTGLSTGPHLHFEAYRGGRTINPMGLSFASRSQVDERELASFRQRLASLLTVAPGAALDSIAAPADPNDETTREIDRVVAVPRPMPTASVRALTPSLAVSGMDEARN